MTRKQADMLAKGCKRFEYDESGLGKLPSYGYNCLTCNHNRVCEKVRYAEDINAEGLTGLSERMNARIEHHGYAIAEHKADDIKAQRIIKEVGDTYKAIRTCFESGLSALNIYEVMLYSLYKCNDIAKGIE